MMIVGAVTTSEGIGISFGSEKEKAFSEEAALKTTNKMVSSLDEFLLALVLFIFAYGVFRLFIIDARSARSRIWSDAATSAVAESLQIQLSQVKG